MTAQGEDILAWLDRAITAREETAQRATQKPWRIHDTHLDHGGHTATVLAGKRNDTELLAWLPTMSHQYWDETRNAWNNAEHIAANDPESVLRRCAADRKLIEAVLADTHFVSNDDEHFTCLAATVEHDGGEHANRHRQPAAECDCGRDERVARYLSVLAEGYGWAGGER